MKEGAGAGGHSEKKKNVEKKERKGKIKEEKRRGGRKKIRDAGQEGARCWIFSGTSQLIKAGKTLLAARY
ncbi:hypothetical protein [Escherichia coli]|uniref:hypothetical protein n=1 Tax=Escherichia coli TaxID=562 RepID=UPI0037DDDD2D